MNNKENNIIIKNFKKDLTSKIKLLSSIRNSENNKNSEYIPELLDDNKNIKYSNTYVLELSQDNPKNAGLDYKYLHEILNKYGLKQSNNPKENHLFGIINGKFYGTKFYLLNNFENIESFDEKYNLYFNLKLHFPLYYSKNYPNSFMLSTNMSWDDIKNNIYIARPISGLSGQGIINVYNASTFQAAKDLLINKYNKEGISLTEYVTNPMLFMNRKMHLRAYMLFTLINNNFKSYLLEYGKILTAKHPYKNEDWNNKDIHDTHMKSTIKKNILFPEDLYGNTTPNLKNVKDWDIIYKNMCECIKKISKIAVSNIYNFSNTINTYEVYGIDILVRDDLSVFIMEINSKYVGYDDTPDQLFKTYFNWIEQCVIKPCLFPQLDIEKSKSTTPILDVNIEDY